MSDKKLKNIIKESLNVCQSISENEELLAKINKSIEIITNSFLSGGKVLFCGNGGSAAEAQHLAAEFSGRFYKDRMALPSDALHCNSSYLTAVANDYSYDDIYSRIISGIGKKGDILIGLSTSGNSKNILNAFIEAKKMNVFTIAFTGMEGGELKLNSDILLNVPSNDTPRIQEAHLLIGHMICQFVEEKVFS
jgi:D-sedoheptulose 7-phosphate isomerase